jgi:FlaA1/EpsC-like NDP-sugar epimerase
VFRNGNLGNRDEYIRSIRANITTIVIENVRSMEIIGSHFPPLLAAANLSPLRRHRIAVTGGTGFIGSHLVDRLLSLGHEVIVIDNMLGGSRSNLQRWLGHLNLRVIEHDIADPIFFEVDRIYHLACAASPRHGAQVPRPLG